MEYTIIGGSLHVEDVPEFLSGLRSISSSHNTIIQAMDANKIAGEEHVTFAIHKAMRAIENNLNVAHDTGVEIMRYASGKRQIGEAFSMGVHEGQMNVVFVVLGGIEDVNNTVKALTSVVEKAPVLEYSESKRAAITEQFSITEKEIEAVGEAMISSLVLERVALVDVLK